MRNPIICLCLLGCLSRLAGALPAPVSLKPLQVKESAPASYDVQITAQVQQTLSGPSTVPVVSSYLRFVAPLRVRGLLEDNLLDSLYAVDLNGNRRMDQVNLGTRDDGTVRLDLMPVEALGEDELGPQQPYRQDGSLKRYFLDPDSPSFMLLFFRPPMLGLELQHRGYRPTVEELPNPNLQVMVFEPCVGPSGPRDLCGEPNFQLSFPGPEPESHLMFCWEPDLFKSQNRMPQWLRLKWFTFPIPNQAGEHNFSFHLDCTGNSNPVGVLAQINYALEPGIRIRSTPCIQKVWPGFGH